jgi:hypothetical protein
MQYFVSDFSRTLAFAVALIGGTLATSAVNGEPLEVTVTRTGGAASDRPLPVGAKPALKIIVRNSGTKAIGPVELSLRSELRADKVDGWTLENNALKTSIKTIPAGAQAGRELHLRVEKAPPEATRLKVSVEAKGPGGSTIEATTELTVADCAGAYRGKLAAMRESLSQPMRDAADELRKANPALPEGRQFPSSGVRSGDIARAERLAANFAARRGADQQFSTEWFRYLVQRWASELNAYTGQAANPGICANNYYQIAGYRQGLLPITKQIDATHAAAEVALAAARKEAAMKTGTVEEIVDSLLKAVEINKADDSLGPLALLADARARSRGKFDAETTKKFSLAETAAWLDETDKRGQKLAQSIEQILSAISTAHKESCNCAF